MIHGRYIINIDKEDTPVADFDENGIVGRFIKAQDSLVIQSSDLSLGSLSDMVAKKAIDLQPHYQRRERWKEDKQSALIESFLLNVPVPPIYLSEDEFGSYSVIDGKQRLTAVSAFMSNELRLRALREFPELNGKTFSDLPTHLSNALYMRPYFRVVTLLKQTDPELKYEVFLRLNTGGDRLRPQEIRNVAFSGKFNDLLINLSSNPFLRNRMRIEDAKSSAYMKMDDVEHVLRFFTTRAYWQDMGGSLSNWMDKYMSIKRKSAEGELQDLYHKFNKAINTCEGIWAGHAFYKPANHGWREQFISPLFDAQMVAVSLLTDAQQKKAITKSAEIITATRKLFANDQQFVKSITAATNNALNVKYRVSEMHKLLTQVLGA